MAQPPAYNRNKNFTEDVGARTDHSALNAELDRASNSINDIRTNLAILQADDGKLRPSVVTADSISEGLRVSLVEGVVMDAKAMLDRSLAASEASAASAGKAKESETAAAASALASASSADRAEKIAGSLEVRVDGVVETSNRKAEASAVKAAESAGEAALQAKTAAQSVQTAEELAEEAKRHAEIANQRGIPIGTVIMFSAQEPPAGYLKADGLAVGRETYPDLFAAIGTTFGEGDGETTFNLPDLIGRFAEGNDVPGTVKEAGLPNATGVVCTGTAIYEEGSDGLDINTYAGSALFAADDSGRVESGSTDGDHTGNIGIDLSRSSSIYGASDTVQPPALTLLPCIKAFDAFVNSGLVDVTGLANDVARLQSVQLVYWSDE